MATKNQTTNKQQVVLMWGGGQKDSDGGEPVVAKGLEGIRVKQIVCAAGKEQFGYIRAFVLTDGGEVFQWGPSSDWNAVPHKSRQIASGSLIGETIAQLASGFHHFAAVAENGDLYTWGQGAFGMLGHGDEQNRESPKLVEALNGIHIIQVACAAQATVVLSQDGKVYTFGSNEYGCNGNGSTEGYQLLPVQIEEFFPVDSISALNCHAAAVSRQGHVYTWGYGSNGQLGHADDLVHSTPKKIESLSQERIVQVSCGAHHTAALASSGKVYSFGSGATGKLGHNDINRQTAPKMVESLETTVISQVSCGFHHTCFLSQAGHLYVCGSAKHGHSSTENFLAPQEMQSLEKYNIAQMCSFGCCTVALATWKASTLDEMPCCMAEHGEQRAICRCCFPNW